MTGVTGIDALASRVTAVVRDAAAATGVDFSYLMAQARVESGLNPLAKAATSSARGLYQFTNATWLDMVRKHGAAHGLGWAADALKDGASNAAKSAILGLRDDAQAAALMAGEFARDNAQILERKLGRAVGGTEMYLAHFLGAGGATKFLKGLAASPAVAAASLLPAAAAANHNVFFKKDGSARTVAEVYARFEARISGSTPPAAPQRPAPHAGTAQLANLLLADLGA